MLFAAEKFLHISSITHDGKVIVVATDKGGIVWYSVKQDGFEDSYLNQKADERTGWEAWKKLEFPNDKADESVLIKEKEELTDQNDKNIYFLQSRYKTDDKSAVAPVQLVSGFGYLYVFRQSSTNTLLVDRFVLDGMNNTLTRKLEVRFKRSKQKYKPYEIQKKGKDGLGCIDSLDFTDIDGNNFYEPTTELSLIQNLTNGWFSVVLVPTSEPDKHRWHIFAYNSFKKSIEITTLATSDEGLFDIKDHTIYDPEPRIISGIIHRTLNLGNITVVKGLTATKYDLQRKRKIENDQNLQLLREAVRILLVIGIGANNPEDEIRNAKVAAISFSLASDGTLPQIEEKGQHKIRRSNTHHVLLPSDALNQIKPIYRSSLPKYGKITGLSRSSGDEVKILSEEDVDWSSISQIKLNENKMFDGLYSKVTKIDSNTFEINQIKDINGSWEIIPEEETGLLFNGMVTGYEITDKGTFRITSNNHGLIDGDEVQISNTKDYNGVYTVTKINEKSFCLDGVKWQAPIVINPKLRASNRQGIIFDGGEDYISLPTVKYDFSQGFTAEAWIFINDVKTKSTIIGLGNDIDNDNVSLIYDGISNFLQLTVKRQGNAKYIVSKIKLEPQNWVHLAASVTVHADETIAKLYKDGTEIQTGIIYLPNSVWYSNNCFGKNFNGKIADVRIWTTDSGPEKIKNGLYLQLTGKETNLAGYWRLDAIAEGRERIVFDFSNNCNNGLVLGETHLSANPLENSNEVIKFENEELIPVCDAASYLEEFEFRIDSEIDLSNTNEKPIFAFTHKGKKNRRSSEWIEIESSTQFTPLSNGSGKGWYKACSNFTIPPEVTLLRSFGIKDPEDSWKTMEIRKHQIKLISDTITETSYLDNIDSLKPLSNNQIQLQHEQRNLSIKEIQEGILLQEKKYWQTQKDFFELSPRDAQELKQKEVNQQQDIEKKVTEKIAFWRDECVRGNQTVILYQHSEYKGASISIGLGTHNNIASHWNDITSSVKVPDGLKVVLYEHAGLNGRQLPLEKDCPYVGKSMNDRTSSLKVETINGNVDLAYINLQLVQAISQQAIEIAKLTQLQVDLNNLKDDITKKKEHIKNSLNKINDELLRLQDNLATSNKDLLVEVKSSDYPPMSMQEIHTDRLGLLTSGVILEFIHPASRLNAIETCEGNVQLSYFDDQGRMHQVNYDVTDSEISNNERWISESLRTCLNFNKDQSKVKLGKAIFLNEEWTIEAWFAYPLPETKVWNTLTCNDKKERHITIKRDANAEWLGVDLNSAQGFINSGYDLKQLASGWHHLAVVVQGKNNKPRILFYLNGIQVREFDIIPDKNAIPPNISIIGNHESGSEQFGKVCEIRLWNIALNSDEIAVNSKALISGYEPNLLAYFPFNKVSDNLENDTHENGNNNLIEEAEWWINNAPIGHFGNQVVEFNGNSGQISCPCPNCDFLHGISIEAWVRHEGFNSKAKIIDIGNGNQYNINLSISYEEKESILNFIVYKGFEPLSIKSNCNVKPGIWTHWAATLDSKGFATIYCNGNQIAQETLHLPDSWEQQQITIGKNEQMSGSYFKKSRISDVRLWNKALTEKEIKLNMNKRLKGEETGLVAYWPLNTAHPDAKVDKALKVVNLVSEKNEGIITNAGLVFDFYIPLISDAVISSEYSTITKDKTAIMRRFFASPMLEGVCLLFDKRIEQLELKWIGNGQFAPTLIGYIEGAPPIPSENLTQKEDYNGATSVELVVSEDVTFNWKRTQESGLGVSAEIFAGADAEASAGFGFQTTIAKVRSGFKGNLESSYKFQNESSITSSSSLGMTDKLQLSGTMEQKAQFPGIGKRFIPKNVGYALVVSAMADVFITRLQRTKKMIGYQVLPIENIPPDINTITFLINPSYTMNGSLDGLTGSCATSQRFFKHVPEMRSQFGSLYPASYFRLQEAYDLKLQIEKQDRNRETYFAQFNSHLVDETSLSRETNKGNTPDDISVNKTENKSDQTEDQQKAVEKEEQTKLEKKTQETIAKQSESEKNKRNEIERTISDQEKKCHANASFAKWQREMENIQIRAGKRNIVNTYVWDADGGWRSESQSFANTAEHSIGGSFNLDASLGFEGKFAGGGVAVELTAQATVNLTQTMCKTDTRNKGIQLNVDLSGVESNGITDYNDYPILPGEKVNRYRFMSFYLEGSTRNFNDFFGYVVDPEWLASNCEEAQALRQAKCNSNKVWRVLHRVTYVERPALMGFGGDMRKLPITEEANEVSQVKAKVEALEKQNIEIQRKLDDILGKLNS